MELDRGHQMTSKRSRRLSGNETKKKGGRVEGGLENGRCYEIPTKGLGKYTLPGGTT